MDKDSFTPFTSVLNEYWGVHPWSKHLVHSLPEANMRKNGGHPFDLSNSNSWIRIFFPPSLTSLFYIKVHRKRQLKSASMNCRDDYSKQKKNYLNAHGLRRLWEIDIHPWFASFSHSFASLCSKLHFHISCSYHLLSGATVCRFTLTLVNTEICLKCFFFFFFKLFCCYWFELHHRFYII